MRYESNPLLLAEVQPEPSTFTHMVISQFQVLKPFSGESSEPLGDFYGLKLAPVIVLPKPTNILFKGKLAAVFLLEKHFLFIFKIV